MTLSFTIHYPPALPTGYRLFRAPVWPIHQYGLDLSTATFGLSSFMIIPVWIPETRSWSGVTNFSVLPETEQVQGLQPKDGHTLTEKMNWLVTAGNGTAPMWTGDTTITWQNATEYRVGCMLWGNQVFAASEVVTAVNVNGQIIGMRRVLPFRREYWDTQPEWMFPQACIAGKDNKLSYDWGRGEIRTMQMLLNPAQYDFAGTIQPQAFWMPADWCLEV